MVRLFDLIWSCAGLALLSPLLLLVAAAIRIVDGGPVFYRQVRVGRGGKTFKILKFKTMNTGSDGAGLPLTVAGDPRITPLGKWLRRWKIDELPQLLNVLTGDMALVGPRPEVPKYVAFYTGTQAQVLQLRPGITDAASITYRWENEVLDRAEDPEAFYIEHVMANKIRINLEYAAKASLWTNFKVILATLGLLPPPEQVRQPGDLRAFDRVPLAGPVQVLAPGQPDSAARPINLSRGGILLESADRLPVGSACDVVLPPDDGNPEGITTKGVILRSDPAGTVVRFTHPLGNAAHGSLDGSDRRADGGDQHLRPQ